MSFSSGMQRALRLALPVLALATAAIFLGAAHATIVATSADCVATKSIGGRTAQVFCGPATATVRVSGKTLRFKGGFCAFRKDFVSKGISAFGVNIGTLFYTTARNEKLPYFGVVLTNVKQGTTKFTNGVVIFRSSGVNSAIFGKSYLFGTNTITLANGMKAGTFSGVTGEFGGKGGLKFSGSFTC